MLTIDQLFNEWFDYKSTRIKASSLSSHAQHFKYIKPYFQNTDMSLGVDNKAMTKFIDHLFSLGLCNKTVQDAKIVVTNMLKYASMKYDTPTFQYHIEYPTENLSKRKPIQFFSKDECKKVFAEMDAKPTPKLLGLVIGLTTGMRIGEICGLKFSDIDFDSKTITVNRTIVRVNLNVNGKCVKLDNTEVISFGSIKQASALVANTPKTINSQRTCPLAALPLKWLKAYKKSPFCVGSDPYILSLGLIPLEPRNYRNWYYEELARLGLPALNPHCMRHTFATQMLHSGVDVATIAAILGHSSPAVTLEIYSHTNEEEKSKQVNAVFGKMFK